MSASTTPTEYPCWASATATLAVTLDLPTPPLPDEMSSGRVFEPFWANGMMRPSAWPWAGAWPAVAAASPWRLLRSSSRSSSVITVNSRSIEVDTIECGRRVGHTLADLVLQRTAGNGERDEHTDHAVGPDVDAAEHAEIDDRTVQFRVLDRPQCVDDLRFRDGDGHSSIVATAFRNCTEFPLRA